MARFTNLDIFWATASVFSTLTATDTPMWITGVVYGNGLHGLWHKFVTVCAARRSRWRKWSHWSSEAVARAAGAWAPAA